MTDVQLRGWVRAGKPIIGKSDGGGLTFTLSKNGTAAWVLRYRYAGRRKELTLGNYPGVSLSDARIKAGEARARVSDGEDVATERRRQKNQLLASGLVRELAADYLVRAAQDLAPRTLSETRRMLDKDVVPRIGGMMARDVTGADIVWVVEKVAERSQLVARRVFEVMSVLFAHGVAKHVVPANPCAGIKVSAVVGARPAKRERIKLTRDEVGLLMTRLPEVGKGNELAIKIILATCVRKSELILAGKSEIDLELGLWAVPPEHAKGGKGFTIPLPELVVGWFKELMAMAGESALVLPSRAKHKSGKELPICHNTLNSAIDRLGIEGQKFSPHDLRSTARSYLAELGVSVVVAERCLNHSLGGLVGVYDQHDYLEERRQALNLWATFLEQAERGEPWNVVPIGHKKSA